MLKHLIELQQETVLCNLLDRLKKPASPENLSDAEWQKELEQRKAWLKQIAEQARNQYSVVISDTDQQKIAAWFAQEPQLKLELENLYTVARELISDGNRIVSPFAYQHKAKKLISESAQLELKPKLTLLQNTIDSYFLNLNETNSKYAAFSLNEELAWLNYPSEMDSEKFATLPKKLIRTQEWDSLCTRYMTLLKTSPSTQCLTDAKETYSKLQELVCQRTEYLKHTDFDYKKKELISKGLMHPDQVLAKFEQAYTRHPFKLSSVKNLILPYHQAYDIYMSVSGSPIDEQIKEQQLLKLYIEFQIQLNDELRKQRQGIVSSDGFSHIKVRGNDSRLFKEFTDSVTLCANYSHSPDSENEQLVIAAKLDKPTAKKYSKGFYGDIVRVGIGAKSIFIINNQNIHIDLAALFNTVYQSEDFKKLYTDKAFPSRLADVNDDAGKDFLCGEVLKQITDNEYRQRNITFTCTQSFDAPILDALLKIVTLHGVNIIITSDAYHYIKQFQEFADYDEGTVFIAVKSIAPAISLHSSPLTLTNSSGHSQEIVQKNELEIKPELMPGLFVKIKYKIWKPTEANPSPRLDDFEAEIATTKLPDGCAFQIVPRYMANHSCITFGCCDLLFPYRQDFCTFLNVPPGENFASHIDDNHPVRYGVLNWFAESPLALRRSDSYIEKVESLLRNKVYSGASHWTELARELVELSQTKLASLSSTDQLTRTRYQTLAQIGFGLWLDVILYDLNDAKNAKNEKVIDSLKKEALQVLTKAKNAYLLDQIADDSNLAKKFNRVLDELAVSPVSEEEKSNSEMLTFATRLMNYQNQSSVRVNSTNGSPQSKTKSQQAITDRFALYLKAANDFIATKNAELFSYPAELKAIEAELQTEQAVSRKRVEALQRIDKNSRDERAEAREFAVYNLRIAQLNEKHAQIKALQTATPNSLSKEKTIIIYSLLRELSNLNTQDAKIIGNSKLLSLLQALESTLLSTTPDDTGEKNSEYLELSPNLVGLVNRILVNDNPPAQLKPLYYSLLQIGLGLSLDLINGKLCNRNPKEQSQMGIDFLENYVTIIHNSEFNIDKNLARRLYKVARLSAKQAELLAEQKEKQGIFDKTNKFAQVLLEKCHNHIASLPEQVRNDAKTQAHLANVEQISYGMQLEILIEKLKQAVQYQETNGQEFRVDIAIAELLSADRDTGTQIVQEMQAVVRAAFNLAARPNQTINLRLQQLMKATKSTLLFGMTDQRQSLEIFSKLVIDKMQDDALNSERNNLRTENNPLHTVAKGDKSSRESVMTKSAAAATRAVAAQQLALSSDLKPPVSAADVVSTATRLPMATTIEAVARDHLPIAASQIHIPRIELLPGTIVNDHGQLKLRDDYLLTNSIEKIVTDVQLDPVFMLPEITEQLGRFSSVDELNTHEKQNKFTIKFFSALAAYISCADNVDINNQLKSLQQSLLGLLPKIATDAEVEQAANLRSLISKLLLSNSDVTTSAHQLDLTIRYIKDIAKINYEFTFDAKPLALATGAAVAKNTLEKARRALGNNQTDLLDECLQLLTVNINSLPIVKLFKNATPKNSHYDLLADMVDSATALLEHKKDKMTFVDMQRVIAIYQRVNSVKDNYLKLYSPDLSTKKNKLYKIMGEYAENHLSNESHHSFNRDTCKAIKLVVELEPNKFVTSKNVSLIRLLNVYSNEKSVLFPMDLVQVPVAPPAAQAPALPLDPAAAPASIASPNVNPIVLAEAKPSRAFLISKKDSTARAKLIDLALDTILDRKPNQACRTELLDLLNRKDPGDDEQGIAANAVQTRLGNNPVGCAKVESLLSDPAIIERLSAKEIADLLRPHPKLIKQVIKGGGLRGNLFRTYAFNPVRRKLGDAEISSLLNSMFKIDARIYNIHPAEIHKKPPSLWESTSLQLARDYIIQPSWWNRVVNTLFGETIHEKFNTKNKLQKINEIFATTVNYIETPLLASLESVLPNLFAQEAAHPENLTSILPHLAQTAELPADGGGSAQVIRNALKSSDEAIAAQPTHARAGSLSGSDDEQGPTLPAKIKDQDGKKDSRDTSPGSTASSSNVSDPPSPRDLEEARVQLEKGIHDGPIPGSALEKKPDTPPIDGASVDGSHTIVPPTPIATP